MQSSTQPGSGDTSLRSPAGESLDGLETTDRPAPLACTECRRKHVKCDASVPICRRCRSSGLQCHYVPSRRGLKRRAPDAPLGDERRVHWKPTADYGSVPVTESLRESVDTRLIEPIAQTHGPSYTQGQERSSVPATTTTPVELLSAYDDTAAAIEDDDALINLFYANFHAAHPTLVPRGSYSSQGYPDYLKLVVHFIGGHFSSMASGDQLRSLAGKALEEAFGRTSRTYHLVQGLLLFSVALHARNEIKESVLTLSQAVSVALELGLHRKAFSGSILGLGEIEEESL
ncbi:unnamed protein product, partial [Clonostachys byssicola]